METIVDNHETLQLNEKSIEEGLNHKNLWEITKKYYSDPRKHIYEQIEKPKNKAIEFL